MKVTLFRDMKAEKWYSMDRYADALASQLSTFDFQFSIFNIEPPLASSKVRSIWRNKVYPNLAKFSQGTINHVLDHSYSHLLNYLNPKRTVVTCHDLIPLDFEDAPSVLSKFKDAVNNLHKAARIIAVSESTKVDLINKLGIDVNKVDVVYSGVAPIFHHFDAAELKQKYKKKFGLPEGKIILNFGSNLRYKNVETVLSAFKDILASNPSTFLLRIHPLSKEQRRLAGDLGILTNYLEITNPSDEDLVGLYNCGEVLLSPSLKEGFGLHVLEALACGTPVVVSQSTSLQEVAGDTGVLVDPKNTDEVASKTLAVLKGDIVIGSSGKLVARASLFNWNKTAEQTVSIYREVEAGL